MKKIVLHLYKLVPFKKELCMLIKKFGTPPKKIYRKLYFEGEFAVPVEKGNSFKIKNYEYVYIEKCIFWKGIYGEWEKNSLQISNYIFDVGANTGVFSLLAKCVNPNSKVYAFEPVQRIYTKLNHNIRLNKYDIQSSNLAVSNTNGETLFYDQNIEHTLTASLKKTDIGERNSAIIAKKIRVTTLDSFIEKNAIPRVDLIKIDVETFEVEVLEGFQENLIKFKPTLLMEVLNEEVANGISKLIANLNYNLYNISESKGITKVDTIHKSSSYNYLICTPEVSEKIGINRFITGL
jgi:FkbM family methyltransferase